MGYESLVRKVLMEYSGSMFLSPAIPEGQAIGRMLLQYRETDWAFLKRIASRFHAALIPDILGSAPRFSVGPIKQQAKLRDGSHVVAKRDMVGNLYEREDRSDRIYGAGSRLEKTAIRKGQGTQYQTVIRFLWSGNTLLHEWETGKEGKRRLREREGEKADYILKMEEKADHKARAEADKGTEPPKNLITWVFQDDFIPRAKLTEAGSYSIISDYLGTPVEAYDEEGKKVWERELDIYGRVKRSRMDRFGKTTELVGEAWVYSVPVSGAV